MRSKSIDFNSLLTCLNLIVASLIASALFREQTNEYVDQQTLMLGILLSLETQVALFIERRRRDPFIILLAFGTILYYSLRLFTLTLFPYSIVFERYAYDADDSNYALIFIIIANVFLYAGLYVVRAKKELRIDARNRRATSPAAVLLLMLATFVLTYFGGSYLGADSTPRVVGVLVVFLSPPIIVTMALTYYFLFRRTLSRKVAVAIGVLILLEIVAHTLWGSRSALVAFVQNCLLVGLAVAGSIRLPRRVVFLGVALLPVAAALLVGAFTISTYNREAKDSLNVLDVGRLLDLANEAGAELLVGPALDILIPPVVARAGFFDFSAEIIAHRDQYSAVINLPSYAKSVVDNILTPGFDVFDQPRLANALQFVYRNWGSPSREQAAQSYQSDQFGIYGEFYALFGYACLPLLFLVAFVLKRTYVRISDPNPFAYAMKRVVVLFIFGRMIDSFGLDWILGDIVPLVAAMFLYSIFFSSKRVAVSAQPEFGSA